MNEQTTRKSPNTNADEFYGNTNSLGGDGANVGIGNGVGVGSGASASGNRLGFITPNGVT